MFLLDTDVLSNFVKQKPLPKLLEWLQSVDSGEIATSLATIFEIQMGVEAARRSDAARAEEKERWLDGLLDLIIAATAIVHQATVVTFNVGDFVLIDRHFPLPAVLDPGTGQYAVRASRDGGRQ